MKFLSKVHQLKLGIYVGWEKVVQSSQNIKISEL